MNRFYKYLKSFDSFILQFSKPLGWILSVLALGIILYRFSQFEYGSSDFSFTLNLNSVIGFGLVLFFCINHGLDGYIWRLILKKGNIEISLINAVKMNWSSLLLGLATPSRIGEIPARRLLLKNHDYKIVYKQAGLHYLFKPLTFLFLLVISTIGIYWINIIYQVLISCGVLGVLLFILIPSLRFTIQVIGLNILRICSYCIQHLLLLSALNAFDFGVLEFVNVVFIHSSGALVPHVFGTEVFIKAVIFDLIQFNQLSWFMFTLSLMVLWIMNIVLPALLALGFKKS